jgi:hypothetical protein
MEGWNLLVARKEMHPYRHPSTRQSFPALGLHILFRGSPYTCESTIGGYGSLSEEWARDMHEQTMASSFQLERQNLESSVRATSEHHCPDNDMLHDRSLRLSRPEIFKSLCHP